MTPRPYSCTECLILPRTASVHLFGNDHHDFALLRGGAELAAHHVPIAVRANLDRVLVDPLEVVNESDRLAMTHKGADRHERIANSAHGSRLVAIDIGRGDHALTIEMRWR